MFNLSDDLTFTVPVSGQNTYEEYNVKFAMETFKPTQIYRGRVYTKNKDSVDINVNDILDSSSYKYNYMTPKEVNAAKRSDTGTWANHPVNLCGDVSVTIGAETFTYNNVYCYYRDARLPKQIDALDTKLHNLLNIRSNILPRIPILPKATKEFFFGFGLYVSGANYVITSKRSQGLHPITVYSREETPSLPFAFRCYNGSIYHSLSHGNGLFVPNYVEAVSEGKKVTVARFDKCPADYYVIWVDRTGAYQCQPFSKRSVFTEEIQTGTVVNAKGTTRPFNRAVTNKWTLNSDWLTEEEYKAYESIFVSPYVYLYDTKYDEGTFVNCIEKSWEEKTKSNSKKLFNLTLKLTAADTTNIVY